MGIWRHPNEALHLQPHLPCGGARRWVAVGFDVLGHMWSFEKKKTFEKEEDDDGPLESNVGRGFMAGMISGNVMRVLG